MPITITNLVAPKPQGVNLAEDVVKIKNALNRIPILQGGLLEVFPNLKLDETNGTFDDKLLAAIQAFQLRHFGWNGADGKIYPNSTTIGKINELLPEEAKPAETATLTGSNIFLIQLSPSFILWGDSVYLIIDDIQNNQRAKFKVPIKNDFEKDYVKQQRILWTGPPILLKDLENADFEYITAASAGRKLGENSYTYVITENEMRIKPIGYQSFQKFQTEPCLSEPWLKASLNDPFSGGNPWITQKLIGKLELVSLD